jgi:hypothetical protein
LRSLSLSLSLSLCFLLLSFLHSHLLPLVKIDLGLGLTHQTITRVRSILTMLHNIIIDNYFSRPTNYLRALHVSHFTLSLLK